MEIRPKPSGETLDFMQRIWELVHALDVRSKRMAQTLGVTGPQRLVVRIIGQKPNSTASDIASTLGMHPSTLTGVLSRLEARGTIVRDVDEADRRRARFRLSAAGKKIDKERKGTVEAAVRRAIARVEPVWVDQTADMLRILSEELEREDG